MEILNVLLLPLYAFYLRVLNHLQSLLLLVVRLYWGWQFSQTGWGKLRHLDRVTGFFTSLHIPAPHLNAVVVGLLEFVGGILLVLGLGSRIISLMLFTSMSVAFISADGEAISQIFSNPGKFYGADPYTFWFAALLILVFGPGKIALDTYLKKYFEPKES